MNPDPPRSPSHSAAASMTGYLYQARYALLRGLQEGRRHPGHELSIEKVDDIAFEEDGRAIELIQTKHHARHGDLSNTSVDLWKTLGIWIQRLMYDPGSATSTRFVFLTTDTAVSGSALSMLRPPGDDRDVSSAVQLLIGAATTSKNQRTATARSMFLALSDAQRKSLVRNVWVFDEAPNIINVREEIEAELRYSAPHDQVSNLTDYLEGWWFKRVISALSDRHSSVVALADMQNTIADIRDNFRRGKLPLDDEIDAMPEIGEIPKDKRAFIHQMTLVHVSDNEVRATIHDYYRAYAQRSRWARQNLLLDGDAERYDRALCDAWYRRFLHHTSDLEDDCDDSTKENAGLRVFRWARQHQLPLRNRHEVWLSSGSFQMLADDVRVGWHPNYKSMVAAWKDEA